MTVPGTGGATYVFNAENQMTSTSNSSASYIYDGDGNRVEKSGSKLYWYSGSEVLDETDQTGSVTNANFNEYVYFGGNRIARRDKSNNVFYYLTDQLGSSRVIVQGGQTTFCYDADFEPFGREHMYTNTCPQNYRFTGKERDTESGLDNFGARYYASTTGRFMLPDWALKPLAVPYAKFGDPQTLNLYTYVENSPLNRIDADGHVERDWAGGRLRLYFPLADADVPGVNETDGEKAAKEDKAPAQNTTTVGFLNSQSVTSKDGSTTTTTNTLTNVTFSETGKLVGATQSTITEVYDNTKQSLSSVKTTDPTSISEKQAVGTVGTKAFNDARESAIPGLATQFGRVTAADARAHPFKYAGAAASAAISVIDPPATIGAAVRALVPAVLGLLDSTTGSN